MGVSFRVAGPDAGVRVFVWGATYRKEVVEGNGKKLKDQWRRVPFIDETGTTFSIDLAAGDTAPKKLPGVPVEVRMLWRNIPGYQDQRMVTVSLVNTETIPADDWPRTEQCFFQAKIGIEPLNPMSTFQRFRDTATLSPDPEERELDLLYRRHASFGAGHGCALHWDVPPSRDETRYLESAIIPEYSVHPLDYDLPESDAKLPELKNVLSSHFLAEALEDDILISLYALCNAYGRWIVNLPADPVNQDIPAYLEPEKKRFLGRATEALSRMKTGVGVLRDNKTAMEAFRLANRVMMMQARHARKDYAGSPEPRQKPWPTFNMPDYGVEDPLRWRPFQLAFLLLNIESQAEPDSASRDILDLIWFPTGGGKTEAYLGVSAFTIFFRRLSYGEHAGGTTILMRYSLRLLTSQQFERASAMICACELIRRANAQRYGTEPISIGLWVGNDATPNRCSTALDRLSEAANGNNPFPVLRCPWCGMQIKPGSINDLTAYGIDASNTDFRLYCPQPGCPYHDGLPVNFVDECLYRNAPTLLLGTVDKFAALPWNTQCGMFFGLKSARRVRRAPDLIIQDELHLMSGPLGTMVGLYETAIDEMCRYSSNCSAKIIASTATIRRAPAQVLGLYARSVLQFPPTGLHADDSYFARTNFEDDGRLYVGALLPAITATTAAVRTFAALMQAPKTLELKGDVYDTYYTLVAYFNSLRELGKAETLASDDIPARMRVIAPGHSRVVPSFGVQNLTSQSAGNVSEVLDRLRRPAEQKGAVALLLSSSMISVGVDVGRLGLMVVNGQPKTSSEYIQASSRVGRQKGRPGLVVTLFSPSKPRDRSHYERFQSYHAAFYRHVEPTSVTPFSPPARARALHAVMVSLVRHLLPGLGEEEGAPFLTDADGERIIDRILARVETVDTREKDAARQELRARLEEWLRWGNSGNGNLRYTTNSAQYRRLMQEMLEDGPAWPTLRSMRNVDAECLLRVTG